MDPNPRLGGAFNLLIGISLLVVGFGILLYSDALYSSMINSCGNGLPACLPLPSTDLSQLYIFFGAGMAVTLYSLKLIFFGILEMKPARRTVDAPESAKIAPPTQPPKIPEKVVASTKVARCSYCDAELPSDATYCPNCFQKRKITP